MEAEHYAYMSLLDSWETKTKQMDIIWDMNNWVTYSIHILFDINTLIIQNTRGLFSLICVAL